MTASISGKTRLCCVMGDPVEHSFSPALHNEAFARAGLDFVYLAFRINERTIADAISALRTFNLRGASITMPNKMACMPHLDRIDPTAQAIGAVNTLVNDEGTITGYNTDGFGCMRAFEEMGARIAGSKLVMTGFGGAGSAAGITAARDWGLAELVIFVRQSGSSWKRASQAAAQLTEQTSCQVKVCDLENTSLLREEMANAQLFFNATNVGMDTLTGQSVVPDASFFVAGQFVMDSIYSPEKTRLLELAEEAGCAWSNGIPMLFYQGVRQFELWTGQEMPLDLSDFERIRS